MSYILIVRSSLIISSLLAHLDWIYPPSACYEHVPLLVLLATCCSKTLLLPYHYTNLIDLHGLLVRQRSDFGITTRILLQHVALPTLKQPSCFAKMTTKYTPPYDHFDSLLPRPAKCFWGKLAFRRHLKHHLAISPGLPWLHHTSHQNNFHK